VTSASNTLWTATKTWGYYAQEQSHCATDSFSPRQCARDQNSAFGTNFQKVVYPKFSLSWIATDEPVFPKIQGLDQLPLRGALRRFWACSLAPRQHLMHLYARPR
jgi:hypothetical protein